jgi:hypothetical protein
MQGAKKSSVHLLDILVNEMKILLQPTKKLLRILILGLRNAALNETVIHFNQF